MSILLLLLFIVIGYLSGSLCSAVIVSRLFSLPDPRSEGSKNPGATNVLRLAGKKYAAMVLAGDMLKGFAPVGLAHVLQLSPMIVSFTCLAAVIGHMYPLFFGYQGGKGVATAIGGYFGINFMLGVLVVAVWLIVANLSRYASIASMAAVFSALFFSMYLAGLQIFSALFIIATLVVYKHRNNITRLLDGEEPKIHFQYKDILAKEQAIYETALDTSKVKDTEPHPEDTVTNPVAAEVLAEIVEEDEDKENKT